MFNYQLSIHYEILSEFFKLLYNIRMYNINLTIVLFVKIIKWQVVPLHAYPCIYKDYA